MGGPEYCDRTAGLGLSQKDPGVQDAPTGEYPTVLTEYLEHQIRDMVYISLSIYLLIPILDINNIY